MKLPKLSLLLALAAGMLTASCADTNDNHETAAADTAIMATDPGTTITDPVMGTGAAAGMDTTTTTSTESTGTADMNNGASAGAGNAANRGASRDAGATNAGAGRVGGGPSTGTRTRIAAGALNEVPPASTGNSTGNQNSANTNVRRYNPAEHTNNADLNIRESSRSSQSAVGGATHPTNIPDRGLNSPR